MRKLITSFIYKMSLTQNSYCDPFLEDFPSNLYEEEVKEVRFRLSSDCCGAGIYRDSQEITCLNCSEPCLVVEDIVETF